MAQTIVVPTDLSENSKAGLRFAIQLEKQGGYSPIYYHAVPFMKPTRWSDARYELYVKEQIEEATQRLRAFVSSVYRAAKITSPKIRVAVEQSPDAATAIINYGQAIGAAAICMGTRGGGRLRKLLGTHTSSIIHSSPVPVFVVPALYRRKPLTRVLYASDFQQLGEELKQVRLVAKRLKAQVAVYHYDSLARGAENFTGIIKKYKSPDVSFVFPEYKLEKPLATQLLSDIRSSRASLAVLFTNQKRGWFEKLFLSSKSADIALDANVPLFILPKK